MARASVILLAVSLLIMAARLEGQPTPNPKENPEVAQVLERLTTAFNAGDAKAIAALWTEDGELIDESNDERIRGRKAIEADYARGLNKQRPAQLEIDIDGVRRVSADVLAVEGEAVVTRQGEGRSRTAFYALLVRKEAGWLIDSVRERSLPDEEGNAEFLKDLTWLNGTWKYTKGSVEVHIECTEVANGNFRSHRFRVIDDGKVQHEGTQVVGWDPIEEQVRSWVFSSDGSFGEGTWERKGERWIARVTGVLPDGRRSAATQIMTPKDKNHFTWQVIDRTVDTRALPNVEEVTLTRIAEVVSQKEEGR